MRAEFQTLTIPFSVADDKTVKFFVFKRSNDNNWQWISGGGEDEEKPMETVRREVFEEIGLKPKKIYKLTSTACVPVSFFKAHKDKKGLYVVPEYCFAIEIDESDIHLSEEHLEYKCVDYDEAAKMLRYDSNKTALFELNERIKADDLNFQD